jgi:N-acetylglucosamine-6-phosphate deacetylase
MGIDPWEAVHSASTVPARALGLDTPENGGIGHIGQGYQASIVIFDAAMNVRDVIVRGTTLDCTHEMRRLRKA